MDTELVKLYVVTINNSMSLKLRGLQITDEEYIYLQDIRETIKLYNKFHREVIEALREAHRNGKLTPQTKIEQNQIEPDSEFGEGLIE
ncbi:MAG: hypothetical protein KGI50_05620 [Patescibacteria group bacterium]|nr:hypothetical protein [Patescibacteria group bacterium]MDE2438890.1 hypothetical protein [Patescibacteria group bacterium]